MRPDVIIVDNQTARSLMDRVQDALNFWYDAETKRLRATRLINKSKSLKQQATQDLIVFGGKLKKVRNHPDAKGKWDTIIKSEFGLSAREALKIITLFDHRQLAGMDEIMNMSQGLRLIREAQTASEEREQVDKNPNKERESKKKDDPSPPGKDCTDSVEADIQSLFNTIAALTRPLSPNETHLLRSLFKKCLEQSDELV